MAVLTKLGKNDTISNNHVTKEGEKFFPLRIFKQCRTERTNPTGFFSEKKKTYLSTLRIIASEEVSNQRNKRDQFELGVKEKRMRELGLFSFLNGG